MKPKQRKELTKNVMLYLIKDCNKRGIKLNRKKLMKLMFLIDWYDVEKQKLRKKPLLGNEWLIYYY